MSAKPYTQTQPSTKPNRNVFDLSHSTNLTLKFGNLYPVMCQEVIPGDTFQIDATFGLRFMPLVFPVQTRMRADLHFFYVRNRNLWKNWKKFFSRTSQSPLQLPYIKQAPGDFWKIGGLADYLGVPVSVVGNNSLFEINNQYDYENDSYVFKSYADYTTSDFTSSSLGWFSNGLSANYGQPPVIEIGQDFVLSSSGTQTIRYNHDLLEKYWFYLREPFVLGQGNTLFSGNSFEFHLGYLDLQIPNSSPSYVKAVFVQNGKIIAIWNLRQNVNSFLSSDYQIGDILTDTGTYTGSSPVEFMNDMYSRSLDNPISMYLLFRSDTVRNGDTALLQSRSTSPVHFEVIEFLEMKYTSNGIVDLKDLPLSQNPFSMTGNTAPKIPISALAFRAYQAVYNSFYRDQINDPFIKNGSPEYDEYITNDGDGADATDYKLYQRNWEQDVFTTAMPSPQQGIAPLLGMSDGNQFAVPSYSMHFTDADGEKQSIQIIKGADNKLSFSVVGDVLDNMPENMQGALSVLNNASSYGISINDLRNVNALQKWLEKAVRNGFRYKDQMESHFGIEIGLKELAIPEYIGGVSKDIDVNVITQQEPAVNQHGYTDVLGHQAGVGTAFGSPKHSVSNYCDEHGFIIGILSVIPIPTYSQALPKHFTKFEPLDFYSPEFSHIGPQPIPIKELTPLQVLDGQYDKVFGYQRAWYDYFSNIDTVHGQFRSTLKDYLVNRTFQTPPELSHDFLVVKNDDVNDIFAVNNEDEDNIVGQIYFDVKAVRPLAKYGTPSIE